MLGTKLISHIAHNYLGGDEDELALDTPLLELNIIDSSSLFDLVDFLRQETGVRIPLKEIKPTNFDSVQSMVALVQRLQSDALETA